MILKFLFFISTALANPAEDAFRIIEGNMTWYDARDLCENQEGAKLAIFDNEAQYLQHFNTFKNYKAWTGIYDESKSDNAGRVWKSSDGGSYGYIKWGPGQPKSRHNDVCVSYEPGIDFQDRHCASKFTPLCRYYKHYPKYELINNYSPSYHTGPAVDDYSRKGMNMK